MNNDYGSSASPHSLSISLDECQLFARPWSYCAAPRSDCPHPQNKSNSLLLQKLHCRGGERFQVLKLVIQNFGVRAGSQQCNEAGDICAICQAQFRDPVALLCQVRRGRDLMTEVQQDYSAPGGSTSHCKRQRSSPSTPPDHTQFVCIKGHKLIQL